MAHDNTSYREAIQNQSNSFPTVAQTPIRCTPEDFPSLYDNQKRKKYTPANTHPLYIANNSNYDNSGNGVCLTQNKSTIQADNDNITSLIERLVHAIMNLSKNNNMKSSECESVIKNILNSSNELFKQNSPN